MSLGDSGIEQTAQRTTREKSRFEQRFVSRLTWRVGSAPPRRTRRTFVAYASAVSAETAQNCNDNDRLSDDAAHEETMLPPSTILDKGNSDPFTVAAIRVTSFVNELLTFNRDIAEPFIMSMEKKGDLEASYQNKIHQTSSNALDDDRTAHANLARLAMLKIMVADDMDTRAAASYHMSEAYKALQQRAVAALGFSDDDLRIRINSLLSFEVVARN